MMDRQFRFVKPNGQPTERELAADEVYRQAAGLKAADAAVDRLIHGAQGARRRLAEADLRDLAEIIRIARGAALDRK
jgi:hypothetical protein